MFSGASAWQILGLLFVALFSIGKFHLRIVWCESWDEFEIVHQFSYYISTCFLIICSKRGMWSHDPSQVLHGQGHARRERDRLRWRHHSHVQGRLERSSAVRRRRSATHLGHQGRGTESLPDLLERSPCPGEVWLRYGQLLRREWIRCVQKGKEPFNCPGLLAKIHRLQVSGPQITGANLPRKMVDIWGMAMGGNVVYCLLVLLKLLSFETRRYLVICHHAMVWQWSCFKA
jgi:hypothetical protein